MSFSFSFGLGDVFNPDEPMDWDEKEALLAIRDREVEDFLSGASRGGSGAWAKYPVTWTSSGSSPTIGNGVLSGFSARVGGLVFYNIVTGFGSSTNGGTGSYSWSLPTPALTRGSFEWHGTAKAYSNTAAMNYSGSAYVGSGALTVQAFLPRTDTNTGHGACRNSTTGAVGEGIPLVAGNYTFTTGGKIVLTGFYEAAR